MMDSHKMLLSSLMQNYPERKELWELLQAELTVYAYGSGNHVHIWKRGLARRILKNVRQEWNRRFSKNAYNNIGESSNRILSFEGYFNTKGVGGSSNNGWDLLPVPWTDPSQDAQIFALSQWLNATIAQRKLALLLQEEFADKVDQLAKRLQDYYANSALGGLLLPYDLFPLQKLALAAARKNGLTSLIYLHGLPGVYSSIDNLRGDYLAVWGNAIKNHYVKLGVDPERILVVGHPVMSQPLIKKELRHNLSNVLVLTKAMPGGCPVSDRTFVPNREGCMAYPFLVQSVLQKMGVTKAVLRPHPSENPQWYRDNLDPSFYSLDARPLQRSLDESTLVIGPASTVWIQAYHAGVHYQIFEPLTTPEMTVLGDPAVPPFDGSDPRVPVASGIAALQELLEKRQVVQADAIVDWAGDSYRGDLLLGAFRRNLPR